MCEKKRFAKLRKFCNLVSRKNPKTERTGRGRKRRKREENSRRRKKGERKRERGDQEENV